MQHLRTGTFRLFVAVFVVGFASLQKTDERNIVETRPQACALTPTGLRTPRARTLEYLVTAAPGDEKALADIERTQRNYASRGSVGASPDSA